MVRTKATKVDYDPKNYRMVVITLIVSSIIGISGWNVREYLSKSKPIDWKDVYLGNLIKDNKQLIPGFSTSDRDITSLDLNGITDLYIYGNDYIYINSRPNHRFAVDPKLKTDNISTFTIDDENVAECGKIKLLEDLRNFKNLETLVIDYNAIENITHLKYLFTVFFDL